jgi:two-component system, response regulator PdtaR
VTRTRVLIAEDETLIRLDLQRLLDAAGFDVCGSARDGREAVALALECEPDVLVLDVNMPELDGIEAARQILAARFAPIVMLTAFSYGELVSRALDAGVAGFVEKPFRETDLVEAIREALRHGPGQGALAYLRRGPKPSQGTAAPLA